MYNNEWRTSETNFVLTATAISGVFFVIPFYLQCVALHSTNCVKTCNQWHVEECSVALLCN
jgi:hypothetical protein